MSLLLNIHSAANRLVFEFNRLLKWSRPGYREEPAGKLTGLSPVQRKRIDHLRQKYGSAFEERYHLLNCLENYFYLDLLDQASERFDFKPKRGLEVLDVGSKSFYYVSVLADFFKPKKLTGIEVEGYCIYQDWHSRYDYAQYYIKAHRNAEYRVMDFGAYSGSADVITYFYPFVTRNELVDWTLPLKYFSPDQMFARIHATLRLGGHFFMVNHGEEEAEIAFDYLRQTPFRFLGRHTDSKPLIKRAHPPALSLWQRVR